MAVKGVNNVINKIRSIYDRRIAATYALCLETAERALQYFHALQPPEPSSQGKFWHNVTGQASARMHTDAKMTTKYVSWLMAHGVSYGVNLELANDGIRAAIRPVIMHFLPEFKNDLNRIWGHAA